MTTATVRAAAEPDIPEQAIPVDVPGKPEHE
jgi:hypothetical protein